MQNYLKPRELLGYSLVAGKTLYPEDFVEHKEWDDKETMKAGHYLPDGSMHGRFTVKSKGCLETTGHERREIANYRFGLLHGDFLARIQNRDCRIEYRAVFVDGVTSMLKCKSSHTAWPRNSRKYKIFFNPKGLPEKVEDKQNGKVRFSFLKWRNNSLIIEGETISNIRARREREDFERMVFLPDWTEVYSLENYLSSVYGTDSQGKKVLLYLPAFSRD